MKPFYVLFRTLFFLHFSFACSFCHMQLVYVMGSKDTIHPLGPRLDTTSLYFVSCVIISVVHHVPPQNLV